MSFSQQMPCSSSYLVIISQSSTTHLLINTNRNLKSNMSNRAIKSAGDAMQLRISPAFISVTGIYGRLTTSTIFFAVNLKQTLVAGFRTNRACALTAFLNLSCNRIPTFHPYVLSICSGVRKILLRG